MDPLASTRAMARAGASDRAPTGDARLAKTARQLEGVFVQQLYKAMRETVPEGGIGSGGAGEDTFTSLMDQHIAEQTPGKWHHGLAGAIERVLAGRMTPAAGATGATGATSATGATGATAAVAAPQPHNAGRTP